MKRAILGFFSILILVMGFTSCKNTNGPSLTEGTVTVNLSGSTILTAVGLHAYLYADGETDFNNPATVLAAGFDQISSNPASSDFGNASLIMKMDDGAWGRTDVDWVGEAGGAYDIYIYTADDSGVPDGSDYMTNPMPHDLLINGNQIINIDFADMVAYVDP